MNLVSHNNITISYYVQVNSLRLKSNVASKWVSKNLWGTIYFAIDGTKTYFFILSKNLISLFEEMSKTTCFQEARITKIGLLGYASVFPMLPQYCGRTAGPIVLIFIQYVPNIFKYILMNKKKKLKFYEFSIVDPFNRPSNSE